ncbi:hypothetical protein HRbin23_01371 [bacterium HR23]|nr:hypothetical protein HRbin23_01371 [bacterium HR23]
MSRPATSPRLRLWREVLPFLAVALSPSAFLGIISGALGWHWGIPLVWGAVVGVAYPIQRRLRGLEAGGRAWRWAVVLGIANALVALLIRFLVGLTRS